MYEISQLLHTQLDKETLATCVSMIENGVNPEALAVSFSAATSLYSGSRVALQGVIQELRRENARISAQSNVNGQ